MLLTVSWSCLFCTNDVYQFAIAAVTHFKFHVAQNNACVILLSHRAKDSTVGVQERIYLHFFQLLEVTHSRVGEPFLYSKASNVISFNLFHPCLTVINESLVVILGSPDNPSQVLKSRLSYNTEYLWVLRIRLQTFWVRGITPTTVPFFSCKDGLLPFSTVPYSHNLMDKVCCFVQISELPTVALRTLSLDPCLGPSSHLQ